MGEFEKALYMIILPAVKSTLYMTLVSMIIATAIGFAFGIILTVTDEAGLKPNRFIYTFLSGIINILRSVPYIILAVAFIPVTRAIVGSSIGENAAIVSLTIASAPFISRLVEASLKEVNPSLVEAAKSFGASNNQIILKVLIREAVPSLISNITLSSITILGLTAMAGAVGAGGLGAVGLTYGYQSFNDQILYSTVFLLIVMVGIIQFIGNLTYKKLK